MIGQMQSYPPHAGVKISIWEGSKNCKNCAIMENNSAFESYRRDS